MKKFLNLFKNRHVLGTESALNQEVGTTIPTIVSDLQEGNVSDYSVCELKAEQLFPGVRQRDLLRPEFWEQFIEE